MKFSKTNRINVEFSYGDISKDFSIIKFTTSDQYIKYGALFLDQINLSLKAESIVFEKGKSFYALFKKDSLDVTNLSSALDKIEGGDKLQFMLLNINDLSETPDHILSQLFLNSISTPSHQKLSFNNLTGKLYLFSPKHFKISSEKNTDQIFKIIGLEIKITSNLSLQLNVKTFTSVLLSKKMDFSKKKFLEYPKYTFVHSTGTLRRVLPSEKVDQKGLYILKQTHHKGVLEKSNIPFLDFRDLEGFNQSKIGLLNSSLLTLNQKISNYVKIDFVDVPITNTVRYKNSFKVQNFENDIHLIDCIDDEDSRSEILKIQDELGKLTPKSTVRLRKKEAANGVNLKLIHNKAFYERYNLQDPYIPKETCQHLTLEDFKVNSKASLKALISESILKNDIKNNQISIINWEEYGFKNKWVFGNKIQDQFYFISIHPCGKLEFETFKPDLFNQNEHDQLCDIFDEESTVEFVVKDDLENINIIKRTQNFTIPEFLDIYLKLNAESEQLRLTKTQAIECVIGTFSDTSKQNTIIGRINSLENWNKRYLLDCFDNRVDKKCFSEFVEVKTGEVLKTYLRDKNRYEILDSQLDIHLFQENGTQFYFVGTKGEGIQQQLPRASTIREIEPYSGSEFIFDKLLPLMNVDFIKNGNLTVFPFPLKYLREWQKLHDYQ